MRRFAIPCTTLVISVFFFTGMRQFKIVRFILLMGVFSTNARSNPDDFSITHYTTENGLPQNSVKAIAMDQLGFYWLATEMGLVRFDGHNFKLFNKQNTGINSNRFIDIQKAVATDQLYGVNEHWTVLPIKNGRVMLPAKGIRDFFNFKLSLESYNHRSWKFDQERDFGNLIDSILIPLSKEKTILVTRNKTFWFLSRKQVGALTIKNDPGFRNIFNIGENLYRLVVSNHNFKIEQLTPKGIVEVKLQGDILAQKNLSPLAVRVNSATGQTFISSGDCLFLIEPNTDGKLNTILLLSGFELNKKVIQSVCYDKANDMLLLGSKVAGLYVLKRKYFHTKTLIHTTATYDFIPNVVEEQVVFNDSSALTDKGLVFSTGQTKPFFLGNLRGAMKYWGNKIIKTRKSVWSANRNFLYQYSPDFKTIINKSVLHFFVSEFAEVGEQIWIGAIDGQVFSLDYHSKESPELICTLKGRIQTMQQDQSSVWIGTNTGLYRVNKSSYEAAEIKELRGKTVRGLYFLADDELWICTYDAGLYLYHHGIIKHFPSDQNGYLNTAHCILEDNHGYLWISTNRGVFQTRKKDLLNYAGNKAPTPFYLYYDKDAGFLSNEFNGGNNRTGIKLPNGFFCFSSMNGWVFFNPDNIKILIPDHDMIVDKIEIDNKEFPATDSLVLENDFDRLTLTVAIAYFGHRNNLQLEYQLDNSKWMAIKNDQITFNAISSGNHLLHTRMRSGFGNEYKTNVIKIRVIPAWWETSAFKGALLLILGILLWLAFRLRFYLLKRKNKLLEEAVKMQTSKLNDYIAALELSEEKLRRENKFQERINKHIIHDIRTPLKYLTLSIKHLYKKISGVESHLEEDVHTIYTTSEQVFQFTGRFINYLKGRAMTIEPKSEIDLYQLIEEKLRIFSLSAKGQHNTLVNLVPDKQTVLAHGLLLDILLHNLLDNCIKNTNHGTIKIAFEEDEHKYIITISDTGKGIPMEEIEEYNDYLNNENRQDNMNFTGLGFSIAKGVLPLINGQITLMENKPEGTLCRLTITR